MVEYGHFGGDGYEYIIANPNTPRPWINYLTNEEYCAVISATGGGYSFYKDSKSERILWWLGPNLGKDRPGRYIFIKDENDAWSLTFEPLRRKYDSWQTIVGLGYQKIKSEVRGIEGEVTYFVPQKDTCEIWFLKIKNKGGKTRNISIFGYVEFFIGSTDYINFYNISYLWNKASYEAKLNAIIARKTASYKEFNIKENPYVVFFGTNAEVSGWDCNKRKFLGNYNTEENPEGVLENKCTQSICDGEEAIGVLQTKLKLLAGEEKTIIFILGETEGYANATQIIEKYKKEGEVLEELKRVKNGWRARIDKIKIETPDSDFNRMINIWAKYQLYICNLWSRSSSFYHEGQGGYGYRDSCQDGEAIVSLDPLYVKEKIRKIASLTRRDGTVAPGWSKIYGPYQNKPFKDHPTWLTSIVSAYIKETGDFSILNEQIPYLKDRWINGGTEIDVNWKGGAAVDGEGTLFEHLLTQLNFTYNDVSVHGLPRVGEADWNDALDMAGRRQIGESVWLAMALIRSLKLLAEIAERINKNDIAIDLREKAEKMAERINEHGWDSQGEWYIGGYNDDLIPFGSSKNAQGKIFLNSQSWAILSGIANPERLKKILGSVEKYLNGKHGLALLSPAYSVFDPGLGRIGMFSKGAKENAAIFCHAVNFMVAAYCKVGMGGRAYEALSKITPNKQKDIELYKTEPYAFAEYIIGPEHPYAYGEGAFTWLTGTAGWAFLNTTENILGVQRDFDGLRINPSLPGDWKRCRIVRPFRGDTYDITIENPEGVEHGIKEVYVDEKKIEGNLIRPFKDGKIHTIKVLMGK